MVIPHQQQAYSVGAGTSPIPQFKFSEVDPPLSSSSNLPLYQGWVNTLTKAIWYLEGVTYSGGVANLSWRSVAPIVLSTVSPTISDYHYPLGQTWVNTVGLTYWGLMSVAGTTATWIDLSAGGASGILTLTGNSGGAVTGDGSRNLNLLGGAGVNVVGNPGTNTLTFSLTGGSAAIDSIQVDKSTGPGTNPILPDSNGLVTFTGGQVVSGSTNNCIQTNSLAANTLEIQIQRSTAVGSSNANNNGVSHFNSGDFTVDSNGYVSALGSGFARLVDVDAHTAPGTNPVSATNLGVITVTGGQVASNTTANCIQTNSLAANTYTVQVQRSTTAGSSTIGLNGVCHFNSTDFTVDANGFVTAIGGGGGSGVIQVNDQVFTTSGTYTPTANMVYCQVQIVGGGGGGGGGSVDGGNTAPAGSGGGGGFYSSQIFSAATIGASKTVTIGAGGAGGIGKNDGSAGSTTSFGSLLSASGGVQGQYMRGTGPVQEGGDGGQASTGTPNYSSFGGGGGYSISTGGAIVSGSGGSTIIGIGGKPRAIAAAGEAGAGYGSGGSGGVATTGVPATGGAGAGGVVIVTEYIT